jgi:hypothetical protein
VAWLLLGIVATGLLYLLLVPVLCGILLTIYK